MKNNAKKCGQAGKTALRAHVMGGWLTLPHPPPSGRFFTTPNGVLHHGRHDHSSPQAQPVLHREAIAELKNKIEKPVLRPGGEELAHKARGEE